MTSNRKLINILFAALVAVVLGIIYLYRFRSPESIGFRPAALIIIVWLTVVSVRAIVRSVRRG